jgi:hypothetical protein
MTADGPFPISSQMVIAARPSLDVYVAQRNHTLVDLRARIAESATHHFTHPHALAGMLDGGPARKRRFSVQACVLGARE